LTTEDIFSLFFPEEEIFLMFLFLLLLWIVDDVLPWFLPKRLHDLLSGLVHSHEPVVYCLKSFAMTRVIYEWILQVSRGPQQLEELCNQNRQIHARLKDIQQSLSNLAEQVLLSLFIDLFGRVWISSQSCLRCKSA
jgi:hypothetical protein